MAAEGMYEAQSPGGVSSTPDLRDPLGGPKIVTGVEYMDALARLGYNVENLSSPLPTMTKIAGSLTSLIDTQYDNAMKWQQSKANLAQTVAKTKQIDSETDFNNQALDYRLKGLDLENKQRQQNLDLLPLDVQAKQQVLKENEFKLQEAQRNADELDKAHNQYQAWHDELAQLDPTDPDYENKIAAINAKYPEASTNPSTQRLISPLIQQQNVKRSQSFAVQQRTDQLNQLRGFQQNGLIAPDTDIQKGVAAGNGQSMINAAKKQGTIHRLQSITAYGSPTERNWAQGQIDQITGTNMAPDPTMFSPNGDLNPGSEALLSTIERRVGITPVAPGAKKETKITTDETGTKTETTITGQPVTAQDITKPAQPTTTTAMPTKPEDMQKDPVFQSVFSDLNAGKLALPGNPKPGTPEFTAGLFAEYSKRKAAAAPQPPAGQTTTTQPVTAPSPAPAPAPQRASKAGRRGLSSTENQGQEQPVAFQPDTSGSDRLNAVFNNPGAMGLTKSALRFGATPSGHFDTGHAFAKFPTKEAGAAAQFSMWQNPALYKGHTLADAITNWIGPGEHGEAEFIAQKVGIPLNTVISDEFLRSPMGIRLMQAQAQYEGQNVLTPEQWKRAQDWAYAGIKPSGMAEAISQVTPATAFNSELPRPKTIEEAKALPPGTHFIDPDGNRRVAG